MLLMTLSSNGAKEFSRIISNELNRCGSVLRIGKSVPSPFSD